MTETWLPVISRPESYEVSSLGRIRCSRTGRVLKPTFSQGRATVTLLYGPRITTTVHRAVAEAFLGPRPDGCDICHGNGDASDNRVENLRYDSRSANIRDAVRHGTYRNGQERKTHCPQGHAYDGSNTYVGPKGWRGCRACRAEASRRHGRKVGVQP